jgi:hypothetical protein
MNRRFKHFDLLHSLSPNHTSYTHNVHLSKMYSSSPLVRLFSTILRFLVFSVLYYMTFQSMGCGKHVGEWVDFVFVLRNLQVHDMREGWWRRDLV